MDDIGNRTSDKDSTLMITASMLYNYDYVQYPHRMTLDLFGDAAERDSPNAFVELLWERGVRHEEAVAARLAPSFVDCSVGTAKERKAATLNALASGATIIYQGRIQTADLVGEPDILRREGAAYAAVDIKSGSDEEGPEDDRIQAIYQRCYSAQGSRIDIRLPNIHYRP